MLRGEAGGQKRDAHKLRIKWVAGFRVQGLGLIGNINLFTMLWVHSDCEWGFLITAILKSFCTATQHLRIWRALARELL